MGHYDTCREENCPRCGQALGFCEHTDGSVSDPECTVCGAKPLEKCIAVAGPNKGKDLMGFHLPREALYKSRSERD